MADNKLNSTNKENKNGKKLYLKGGTKKNIYEYYWPSNHNHTCAGHMRVLCLVLVTNIRIPH